MIFFVFIGVLIFTSAHAYRIGGDITGGNYSVGGSITGGDYSVGGDITGGDYSVAGDITGGDYTVGGDITGGDYSVGGDITGGDYTVGGDITGGDYTVGGDITGADVIAGDISQVSITAPAGRDDAWLDQNGGWIRIVNSFVQAGRSGGFCQRDCHPSGICRCLPARTYHGIYIAGAEYADDAASSSWSAPARGMISVEDRPASQMEPNQGKIWVPAGTYRLVEYFFQTEINPGDIDYMPCTHWLVRPARSFQVLPGSNLVFDEEDLDASDLTCRLQFQADQFVQPEETVDANIRDARVYEYSYLNWDDANWGGDHSLALKSNVNGIPGTRGRIYLWFDPSAIAYHPGSDRVLLRLAHHPTDQAGEIDANVYRVTQDWTAGEGTYHPGQEEADAMGPISWNNQPSVDMSRVYASQILTLNASTYYVSWDITELVNGWTSGEYPNRGLVIVGEGEGTASYSHIFTSTETEDPGFRPAILVAKGTES